MLYMMGTLIIDTRPFSIDVMDRDADASIVAKPVIGGFTPKEFTGEGEDEITLSGQLLPIRIGGLDQLEIVHEMRKAGTRFPLMRGDGWRYGWFAITRINESHAELNRNGVPFIVKHSITMTKTQSDSGSGQQIIDGLLSLFSVFN